MLLKIGDAWIDPTTIRSLVVLGADEEYDIPDRVIVHHGDGHSELICCDSYKAATRECDRIAEEVNSILEHARGA